MCNLAALACILFKLWNIKVIHFLTILCVTLWAPHPPAQPLAPPGTCTYLYTLCHNFLHPNDLGLFYLFQSRDIKLQIDTKVNVLGLVEVLTKMSNTQEKGEPWNNSTIFEGPVHNIQPPQKLGILTAWLNTFKSLSISTSIQWEGVCWSMPKTFKAIMRTTAFEKLCDSTCEQWCMPSKVSWIGILVCDRICEKWCMPSKVTWIGIIILKQKGRHAIASYFKADYTIVWFYHDHDVWYWHGFAEFWHRLHWLKTAGLMPSISERCLN